MARLIKNSGSDTYSLSEISIEELTDLRALVEDGVVQVSAVISRTTAQGHVSKGGLVEKMLLRLENLRKELG